jgi:hypothetical protein
MRGSYLRRSARIVAVGAMVAVFGGALVTDATPRSRVAKPSQPVAVAVQSADFADCPSGWVCLWEHSDFTGQMVAFKECCSWHNLADVGFNNQTSSWRNRKAVDAKVADLSNGDGDRLCLNSWSSDGWIGATWNDRASSIKIFSSDAACT